MVTGGQLGLAAVLVAAVFGAAAPATAQTSGCPDVDDDAFAAARRSRRIVSDYEALHGLHWADMARNEALYVRQTGRSMPWRFGLAGVVDWSRSFGYDVCSNLGPWTGSLQPLRLGAIATLSLPRIGLDVEAFAMLVQDRLVASPTEAQVRGPDGTVRDPVDLANVFTSEAFYGGRLTISDWVTVLGGYIRTAATQNVVGEDGRRLIVGGETAMARDRAYLGAGIPRLRLYTHILFDAEDLETDTVGIELDRLALPWWSLQAIAGVAWIDDEQQLTVKLGVGNILGLFTVEFAVEHQPFALRYARVRVDWETSFGQEPPARGTVAPEDAQPRFAVDIGTFAELSWFGSAYMEAQTGQSSAPGVWAGIFARPDITLLMAQIDLFFGINRPESIDRLVQAAGHWQVGLRLQTRFGL